MVREILLAAADEIVDGAHRISALHQQIHHMATDESGAAGNDRNRLDGHASPLA